MKLGTKVTNKLGWTGHVVERPKHWHWKCPNPRPDLVYVHWNEREDKMKGATSADKEDKLIKDPVVSALMENLTVIS